MKDVARACCWRRPWSKKETRKRKMLAKGVDLWFWSLVSNVVELSPTPCRRKVPYQVDSDNCSGRVCTKGARPSLADDFSASASIDLQRLNDATDSVRGFKKGNFGPWKLLVGEQGSRQPCDSAPEHGNAPDSGFCPSFVGSAMSSLVMDRLMNVERQC